jgi:hypothetical protein
VPPGIFENRHPGVQLTVVACDVEARRQDEGTQGGLGEEYLVRKVSNHTFACKTPSLRWTLSQVSDGRSPKSPWGHVLHHNGDLDETDAFELH